MNFIKEGKWAKMNRITELIKEYCPDGVEIRCLEDCCNLLDKKRQPITKASREAGEYPYYGANGIQDYVANYIFDGTFVLVGEDGSVITKSGTPVVTWAEGKIWVNNHAHIIEEKDGVMLRYLYHYLQTIDVTSLIHGNIPKLTGGDFKALKIPVPPLEVQREIVHILDSFTLLTAELTAELAAELTARKKQYEFYRDNLIKKEQHISEVKKLADVANIYDSLHQTPSYSNSGYSMVRVQDIKGGYLDEDKTLKVDESVWNLFTQKYTPRLNDIVVSRVGSYGNFALIPNDKCCLGQNVALIHPNINPKYLYHVLMSTMTKQWINNNVKGASQKSFSLADIKRVPVPVPKENIQQRIAEVLDNFEAICTDLNIGLPAEIEARQKQYEYYRDLLLTFAETGSTLMTDRQKHHTS